MTSPSTGSTFANVRGWYLAENWWLEVSEHPERDKVRIREVSAETAVLANADYGYAADIGTPFTQPNPTTRLHNSSH